jgi:hypothetical protein
MLRKKMNDLTVGESLKISAIITVVCFIPTLAFLAYEWIKDVDFRKKKEED